MNKALHNATYINKTSYSIHHNHNKKMSTNPTKHKSSDIFFYILSYRFTAHLIGFRVILISKFKMPKSPRNDNSAFMLYIFFYNVRTFVSHVTPTTLLSGVIRVYRCDKP